MKTEIVSIIKKRKDWLQQERIESWTDADTAWVAFEYSKLSPSPSHAAQDKEGNPLLIECFADNGEFSHWHLINPETGTVLWSSFPEETLAGGEKIDGMFYELTAAAARPKPPTPTPEGSEDDFVNRLLAEFNKVGIDTRTWDGDGLPEEIIAQKVKEALDLSEKAHDLTAEMLVKERLVPTPEGRTAEEVQSIAWKAWTAAANAYRMYPNNKHAFSDHWAATKQEYIEQFSRPTQQTPTQEDQMEKSLRLLDKFMKEKPEQFAEIVKRIDALPDTGGPTVKELLQACRQERKEKHKHDCTRPEIVNFDAVSDICLSCGTYYPIYDTGSDRKGESHV